MAFEVASFSRLVHLPLGEVVLGQDLEALAQVGRGDELDDLLGGMPAPLDAARPPVRAGGGLGGRVDVRQAPLRGSRRSAAYREDVAGRGVDVGRSGAALVKRTAAERGARARCRRPRPPPAWPRRRRARACPARTLRISFSSASTSNLPIREAASPRAVCASCSFSSSRVRTRRSPEKVSWLGSSRRVVICGRVPLAVAVDATVALLDADERPGDVEVDEVVALEVQVDTLGGDIAGDEDADG